MAAGPWLCDQDWCGLIHARGCHAHVRIKDEEGNDTGQRRPCMRAPIKGGVVCIMHGGKSKIVLAKARDRLQSLVHPAIDALREVLTADGVSDADRVRAAREVLDRVPDTIRINRNEITGREGTPLLEDPITQALAAALRDPEAARRLDAVARDVQHALPPAPPSADDDVVDGEVSEVDTT